MHLWNGSFAWSYLRRDPHVNIIECVPVFCEFTRQPRFIYISLKPCPSCPWPYKSPVWPLELPPLDWRVPCWLSTPEGHWLSLTAMCYFMFVPEFKTLTETVSRALAWSMCHWHYSRGSISWLKWPANSLSSWSVSPPPQGKSVVGPLQGCLSIPRKWQLISPRATGPKRLS